MPGRVCGSEPYFPLAAGRGKQTVRDVCTDLKGLLNLGSASGGISVPLKCCHLEFKPSVHLWYRGTEADFKCTPKWPDKLWTGSISSYWALQASGKVDSPQHG